MALEKQINIVVKETGLDAVQKQVNNLDNSLDKLQDTNKKTSSSFKDSANSVLDNGGAMGLLNDATGGLAMTVKDAVEASVLFTKNTKIATIAQKAWNWAISLNPIGLIVASILLAITAIASLTMYLYNSAKANKEAMNATTKNTKALEAQSTAAKKAGDSLKTSNDQQYAMAQAAGASTDALRKLTVKHNEEAIALNLKNAKIAQSTFLRQRDTLAVLEANGASDEAIEKQKKLTDATYKEFQEQNKLLDSSYKERHAIERKNAVELLAEKTEASKKATSESEAERQKERDRIKTEKEKEKADAVQYIKDLAKAKADAEMQSAKDAMAILDELNKNIETPAQKEQREYEEKKAVLEENNLSTEELTVQHIDKMFAINEDARIKKEESDKASKEKQLEEENKFNNNLLQAEESLKNAKLDAANFTTQLITQIAGKNKAVAIAMLAVEKGLAIAQIVSSAGKSIANATANLAAVPAVIGVVPNPMYAVQAAATVKGIAATKISAGISIASILAQSITSAKGMIASGDSGGGSSGSTPSAPSFNLVQGTGTNQIAQGLSQQGAPIKAYVVSSDVSTSQSLDRNIVSEASLG